MRSVAETDMAIIRSKRGQGAGGAGAPPGAVKAKYRKRSVSDLLCIFLYYLLTVCLAACDPAWQVSLLQYPGDA